MKILIADDDNITRALVKRTASHVATSVIEADNGLDALTLVQSEDPDILITDLRMPIIDGFELIATLRESPEYRLLPIICLSSVSQREEIARLASIGITDYVLKPPKPAEITERLTRIIRQQSNWKASRPRGAGAAQPPTLLLVEHDVERSAALLPLLQSTFDVVVSENGTDALRVFRSREPKPTVVLVSEGLPLLSEDKLPELIRRLVPEPRFTELAILLLANAGQVTADKAAKFDGVVDRSLAPDALVEAVRGVLNAA